MAEADSTPRPVSPTQALQNLVAQLQAAAARTAASGTPTQQHDEANGEGSSSTLPAVNVEASLQSIIAAVTAHAQAAQQANAAAATSVAMSLAPPWQVDQPEASSSAVTLSSLGKRPRDETEDHEQQSKARRLGAGTGPNRVIPMTTVICLHAAVAQKSYSTEKRFLCPPPVVHVEGPVWHMRSQHLAMSVVSETGERSFDQKTALDTNMAASFKFLHVAGTGKAKSFQLTLDIAEPTPGSHLDDQGTGGRVWASFDSAPVTIISKPSKKTAKTRNISSCILAGGPVSLFNRINSQTVRTKYMTIENSQLCASNSTWSAFTVNVARRATDTTPLTGPMAVTYGSEIILSDASSGISTAPLVVRKVEKGRIIVDDGGPVSQMQKIALQRINPDGTRHYLSAAYHGPQSNAANSQQNSTHPLLFTSSHLREETRDGVRTLFDELDDALCWTIVGISKFQYTFFDAFEHNNGVPKIPITPFPTLYTVPLFRPQNNTMELTAANFFYTHPQTQVQAPLDVYLGNMGPLKSRVYQSPPAADPAGLPRYAAALGGDQSIIIVDMPSMKDIINALAEEIPAAPGRVEPSEEALTTSNTPAEGSETNPPVAVEEATAPRPQDVVGRTLPLLFIRAYDGVGYHSGRTLALENMFAQYEAHGGPMGVDSGWLTAAQQAMGGELGGWTLRVL